MAKTKDLERFNIKKCKFSHIPGANAELQTIFFKKMSEFANDTEFYIKKRHKLIKKIYTIKLQNAEKISGYIDEEKMAFLKRMETVYPNQACVEIFLTFEKPYGELGFEYKKVELEFDFVGTRASIMFLKMHW